MEHKAPPLWDASKATPRGLRLPNTSPSQLLKTEELKPQTAVASAPPKTSEVVLKSVLSAEAPEFVPLSFQTPVGLGKPSSASSVQNRLRKHKINEQTISQENDGEFIDSPDDVRLQHLITTLTKDPGQFSDLLDLFMDTLNPYFDDIHVLARAARLLVTQAVDHQSFRYSAAKLCCCIEQFCPEFRAELHLTCEKELDNTSNKRGLVLFVAELYTQLHHENIYGSYLVNAYKHLVSEGGNDNVKCICQSLKLTGHSLELYDKKALDDILVRLNSIKSSVTGTALNLVNSMDSLRAANWGHDSTPSSANSSVHESENSFWDETSNTVFYNMDGSKFSSEENDFLAAHMTSTEEYGADLSDPDELCDPEPEMDEEIQAAFKDFVKLSKR